MRIHRFPSRGDAERFLISEGFRFQGAPNRWRKQADDEVVYADIRDHGAGVVVVITERTDG